MNDHEIIKSILLGNKDNFRLLVERYQNVVFRISMGFVHEKEEAEDITQEVFIRAWQSLTKFRGDSSFSTWLHRVTVNACLNNARKKKSKPFFNRISTFFHIEASMQNDFIDDVGNAEENIIREEHNRLLKSALESLPQNQRVAIILSKYEDLPQKEIAAIMNISEGAVEALMHRAKENLRERLSTGLKKNARKQRKITDHVSNR